MREEGVRSREINVPPSVIYEAITDFPSYPVWTANVRKVEVLEKDDEGRPFVVRYTAGALGIKAVYTLRYEFDPPRKLSWVLTEGRLSSPLLKASIRHLDGHYQFDELEGGRTLATYRISAELSIPLGPLRSRAEDVIVNSALKELQEYVES